MSPRWRGLGLLGLALRLAGISLGATVFEDDFARDPQTQGWRVFGDDRLFSWDAAGQRLEVVWDSTRPNSCFHRPLGTVVGKEDDFALAFDLTLDSLETGVTPGKPFAFELAVGLLRFVDATATNYLRGTGTQSPNLVEFDYFPDTGYGATVWPALVSSNGLFNFNGPQDYQLRELELGAIYRIEMVYRGQERSLTTRLSRDGAWLGPPHVVRLQARFTDFRLDAFAVKSYSDQGAAGSVRARGFIDNVRLEAPDPPVERVAGRVNDRRWRVEIAAQARWHYALERTRDFLHWAEVAAGKAEWPGAMELVDPDPVTGAAWYRVRADMP